GIYRIDPGATDEFIVQDATVERMALASLDGFWVGFGTQAAVPLYFAVPPPTDPLRLFVGRPLRIYRPDGTIAVDAKDESIGELSVPVNGQFGAWRVESPVPAHVKLLNVEPIVACGTPQRLFSLGKPLPRPAPPTVPSPEDAFVPGVIGQALHLSRDRALKFPRGQKLPDGSYERFPANEGTIELWFRPNWSSQSLAFKDRQLLNRHFVHGDAISFYYRYGAGPVRDNLYSYVDLLTQGPLGKPGQETPGHIGGHARHLFRAGDWTHLAATWKLQEGKRGTEGAFAVFLDGHKMEPTWNYPRSLTGREPYRLREVPEQIGIGPADGCLDELRISKVVRYESDFKPPTAPFAPDANTLALFHFDGNTEGLSGAAGGGVVAK
ncbi:MAG: LamG domain-containing protein, partial [Planctomycetes bacterium]|nr:LamG domain-containing protein [Planctomycetota bacterium]